MLSSRRSMVRRVSCWTPLVSTQLRRNWRAESTTCWGQLPNQRRQHVRHCCWHYQGRSSNQFPNLVVLASHAQHFVVNSWMIYHQHFEDLFWQIKELPGLLENKILSSKQNQWSIVSRPFQSKMASMVAVLLKNKTGTAYRLFTYVANCSGDVWYAGTPRAHPGPVPPRRVTESRSNRSHPSQSLTYSYNTCFKFGFVVQYSDLVRPGQSRDPFGGSI